VYIHHFFADKTGIADSELLPLIEKTMDTKHPREWYAALMDYGSHLKQTIGNVSRKSAHHTKQSKFKGSNREVRGVIIRLLTQQGSMTLRSILKETNFSRERCKAQLAALLKEGMIVQKRGAYLLP
jgi:A/G-specific adenine glycosylase